MARWMKKNGSRWSPTARRGRTFDVDFVFWIPEGSGSVPEVRGLFPGARGLFLGFEVCSLGFEVPWGSRFLGVRGSLGLEVCSFGSWAVARFRASGFGLGTYGIES